MSKKKTIDLNTPEAHALREEIFYGAYLHEGSTVAFPLSFPGQSTPIPLDESRITALDTHGKQIYGGTSGAVAHVFVAEFRGPTGGVFDLGPVDGATECAAICCVNSRLFAAVNGPQGGHVLLVDYHHAFNDMLQEWDLNRTARRDLGEVVPGEPIAHAVALPNSDQVIGVTSGHVFLVDAGAATVEILGEAPGVGHITLTPAGAVLGQDGPQHLWRLEPTSRRIERTAIALPSGDWSAPLRWARDSQTGSLYLADADANLYRCDESNGYAFTLCGKMPLAPAGPMAVVPDGRLFGFCGTEMAHLCVYEPGATEVRDLGLMISVVERRRYGYEFGAATIGTEGEILFGENDNLGHLWHYHPREWVGRV